MRRCCNFNTLITLLTKNQPCCSSNHDVLRLRTFVTPGKKKINPILLLSFQKREVINEIYMHEKKKKSVSVWTIWVFKGTTGTSELSELSRVTWRLYKVTGLWRNAPEQRISERKTWIKSTIRNITIWAILWVYDSMKKAAKTVNSNDLNPKMWQRSQKRRFRNNPQKIEKIINLSLNKSRVRKPTGEFDWSVKPVSF